MESVDRKKYYNFIYYIKEIKENSDDYEEYASTTDPNKIEELYFSLYDNIEMILDFIIHIMYIFMNLYLVTDIYKKRPERKDNILIFVDNKRVDGLIKSLKLTEDINILHNYKIEDESDKCIEISEFGSDKFFDFNLN